MLRLVAVVGSEKERKKILKAWEDETRNKRRRLTGNSKENSPLVEAKVIFLRKEKNQEKETVTIVEGEVLFNFVHASEVEDVKKILKDTGVSSNKTAIILLKEKGKTKKISFQKDYGWIVEFRNSNNDIFKGMKHFVGIFFNKEMLKNSLEYEQVNPVFANAKKG